MAPVANHLSEAQPDRRVAGDQTYGVKLVITCLKLGVVRPIAVTLLSDVRTPRPVMTALKTSS